MYEQRACSCSACSVLREFAICIGNSTVSRGIWDKYRE